MAKRHAFRDTIIRVCYQVLMKDPKCSVSDAIVFLEKLTGLGESKIRRIINHPKAESVLSTDNLAELAVLLQRISEMTPEMIRLLGKVT